MGGNKLHKILYQTHNFEHWNVVFPKTIMEEEQLFRDLKALPHVTAIKKVPLEENEVKERPILFSGPMVRAIREDRKTMTRRVIKPQPELTEGCGFSWKGWLYGRGFNHADTVQNFAYKCPYGKSGDRLYVRESARVINVRGGSREIDIEYQADGTFKTVRYPERLAPAPKGKLLANGTYREASRIILEITNVRVERLQDISEEDAKAEGCELHTEYMPMKVGFNYRQAFGGLWESINGPDSWTSNPWVWVVEFMRIEE